VPDFNKTGTDVEILVKKGKGKVIPKNSVALVRKRTVPTERPPLVCEVSANFCG
jgi:hypothetical protein